MTILAEQLLAAGAKLTTSKPATKAKKLPVPPPKQAKPTADPKKDGIPPALQVQNRMPLTGKAALRAIADKAVASGAKITVIPAGSRIKREIIPQTAREIAKNDQAQRKAKPKPPAKPAAKPATGARPDGLREGSKMATAIDMVLAKGGATTKEIAKKLGWTFLSPGTLKRYCATAKVKLSQAENGRFHATRA